MDTPIYTKSRIESGLEAARRPADEGQPTPRVLFAPGALSPGTFQQLCTLYSRLRPGDFENVVIVESDASHKGARIPVNALDRFETPLGSVPVNDRLRNEFCDEDDDFYVDEGHTPPSPALTAQLVMLQAALGQFSAVSIRMLGDEPFLIREVAGALDELLANRSTLVVCCCQLNPGKQAEFEQINDRISKGDTGGLLAQLNADPGLLEGAASFAAGVLLCRNWNLDIRFGTAEAPLPQHPEDAGTREDSMPGESAESASKPSLIAGAGEYQASAAMG